MADLLEAEKRQDYTAAGRRQGKRLSYYKLGQLNGFGTIVGEVSFRRDENAPLRLKYQGQMLPMYPPHTLDGRFYRKAGYLALKGQPNQYVRVMKWRVPAWIALAGLALGVLSVVLFFLLK